MEETPEEHAWLRKAHASELQVHQLIPFAGA